MPEPLSEARLAELRATPCAWCCDDPFVPEGQHRRGCPFGDLLAAYDAMVREPNRREGENPQ